MTLSANAPDAEAFRWMPRTAPQRSKSTAWWTSSTRWIQASPCSCESTDVFDEGITLPKTQRGDLLTIKSAGAYGMSMASRYNLHDLPAAVYSDEIN